MTFKKFEKVLLLNGKHRLVLSNHKTSKDEGWKLRQEGSGTNLPTLSSVDKLVAEGFLQANGSSHKERFVLVPNCMRVPTGELNDAGKAATRNVPDGTHRAQVTLSLKDGKDGTVRMTLSFKEDGEGRWIPTLQVSRPSGGPRGAVKKAPVSEDELF
jgi:hypothetical protein